MKNNVTPIRRKKPNYIMRKQTSKDAVPASHYEHIGNNQIRMKISFSVVINGVMRDFNAGDIVTLPKE